MPLILVYTCTCILDIGVRKWPTPPFGESHKVEVLTFPCPFRRPSTDPYFLSQLHHEIRPCESCDAIGFVWLRSVIFAPFSLSTWNVVAGWPWEIFLNSDSEMRNFSYIIHPKRLKNTRQRLKTWYGIIHGEPIPGQKWYVFSRIWRIGFGVYGAKCEGLWL